MTDMFALTTYSGTAMALSGICIDCYQIEQRRQNAREWAHTQADYDGEQFRDVTGNQEISCQFCGKGAGQRKIVQATPEDAGCYVDGHWGQYAIAHMIERATEWGYSDNEVERLAAKHLASMGPSDSEPLTDTEWEYMHDSADEVENWLNEHVAPEGYYWYWNDGEFFLGTTDEDE